MRIYAWNVNGLRAVHRKGALKKCIEQEKPDVLLLQEIKAKEEQLSEDLRDTEFLRRYNSAEKAGYAGTAVWVASRHEKDVEKCSSGMPGWKDDEGRVIRCDFSGGLTVIGVYVPNGGKSEEAYREKLRFLSLLAGHAEDLQKNNRRVIIAGDFNVARSELDLAEPEKHLNHTHYNPEAREHMEKLTAAGMVDTYRTRNPEKKGAYSYWDNFSFSLPRGTTPREANIGWRLDYVLADAETDKKIKKATIHKDTLGSDHCPVSVFL